jgi:3-dehydroquinate synthase
MTTSQTVHISLATETAADRSYDIHVDDGLLGKAGTLIKPLLKRSRVAIVTDETVHARHGATLQAALEAAGIASDVITLPAGEQTKNFTQLQHLCDELIKLGIERNDVIVAFGGGVIGDITGFAASILRRGCRFVQIPTTLLAQVDSSVGGKTAINSPLGKNLIGAFYQPEMVIADVGVLSTLPKRQLLAGYAEVVKYGLLGDAAFFDWLEANGPALLAGDTELLIAAVSRSVSAKARIVEQDEREGGLRALLNLGHTFGHAFEAATGYSDKLFHGEGVALGMACAFDYCAQEQLCPPEEASRVSAHLASVGLPAKLADVPGLADVSAETLVELMHQDKKVSDGRLTFILVKSIGEAYIERDVSPEKIISFLDKRD